jgi:formylglycine-generating enzyme required for sulfatase activity
MGGRIVKEIKILLAAGLLAGNCLYAGTFGDYTYSEADGKITITKYKGAGGKVVIPSEIDEKPVTSIGDDAFFNCNVFTSITIPSSVTKIGDGAFKYCVKLKCVTFSGDAPTSMGSDVFRDCAPDFTVHYYEGKKGFTTPIWLGYPCSPDSVKHPLRAWTSKSGKSRAEAVLLDNDGESIRIQKTDGTVLTLKHAQLSEADIQYLQSLKPETGSGNKQKDLPPPPGKEVNFNLPRTVQGLNLELVPIKPGKFKESPRSDREITITKPFWFGKYEVTQEQYEKIMGKNPSHFKGEKNPVETVSWFDAVEFCKKLTEKEKHLLPKGYEFRLPTEAEWKYCCRAGTETDFSFGNDIGTIGDYAWHKGNSNSQTHPTGLKKMNPWGLFDMYGNVGEWCLDWRGVDNTTVDPKGALCGSARIHIGGDSDLPIKLFRIPSFHCDPSIKSRFGGFRVCLGVKIPISYLLDSDEIVKKLVEKLENIVVSDLKFEESTITEVVRSLMEQTKRLDPEKRGVMISLQLKPEECEKIRVTMVVDDIPLKQCLQYLCSMSGLKYEVRKDHVVIFSAKADDAGE